MEDNVNNEDLMLEEGIVQAEEPMKEVQEVEDVSTPQEEKKEKEFQLSYETGEDLYLAKGYGRQMSGGYSIQVEELGESSNGIFFVTKLLGPEDLKEAGVPSYPCIVIKTRKQEKPVTFRESSSPVKKESEKGE